MVELTLSELREQLAGIEHERWAGWQKWLHSKFVIDKEAAGDLYIRLAKSDFDHWERQIATPYSELSEAEKDSDRAEVDRYLPLLIDWFIVHLQETK